MIGDELDESRGAMQGTFAGQHEGTRQVMTR